MKINFNFCGEFVQPSNEEKEYKFISTRNVEILRSDDLNTTIDQLNKEILTNVSILESLEKNNQVF